MARSGLEAGYDERLKPTLGAYLYLRVFRVAVGFASGGYKFVMHAVAYQPQVR